MNNQTNSGLKCNSCGSLLPPNVRFCTGCGSRDLSVVNRPSPNPDQIICGRCGKPSPKGCRFCVSCGSPLSAAGVQKEKKKKSNAGALIASVVVALVILLVAVGAVALIMYGDRLGMIFGGNGEGGGDRQTSYTQDNTDDGDEGDASFEVSSEEPVVIRHDLPADASDSSYREFALNGQTFGKVRASSYADWRGTRGLPYEVFDGNINSSWQDGKSAKNDYGIGEWLLVYNSDASARNVSSVTVYNGYQNTSYNTSSRDFYMLNSRVKEFTLEFDDGSTESFTLADTKSPQTFTFDSRETCYIRFTINGVYQGNSYSDTCLSEIIYQ